MIKPGDLVVLADDNWKVPGALTAIKYFQRLRESYGGKVMLVLSVQDKSKSREVNIAGADKSVVVMVDGLKQVFTSAVLKVVNEETS